MATTLLHMGLGDVKEGFLCLYQPSVFNICYSPVCALSICLLREEETGLARKNLIPFR